MYIFRCEGVVDVREAAESVQADAPRVTLNLPAYVDDRLWEDVHTSFPEGPYPLWRHAAVERAKDGRQVLHLVREEHPVLPEVTIGVDFGLRPDGTPVEAVPTSLYVRVRAYGVNADLAGGVAQVLAVLDERSREKVFEAFDQIEAATR